MSACGNFFQDLVQVNQPQVAELERVGGAFPDAQAPGACEAFTRQVQQVQGVLRNTYGMAASLALKGVLSLATEPCAASSKEARQGVSILKTPFPE